MDDILYAMLLMKNNKLQKLIKNGKFFRVIFTSVYLFISIFSQVLSHVF